MSERVKVRLPASARCVRVGAYQPGIIYEVPASEADRLVKAKGFERVTTAPTEKAKWHKSQA